MGMPIVGRGQELAQARAALVAASGGAGRLVLVSGEPGIGKSRLAAAIADMAGEYDVPGRITTVAIWGPLAAWTAWSARVLDVAYPEQRGCCSGQLSSAPVTGRGLPSRLIAAPR
jgi:hypothetical protein